MTLLPQQDRTRTGAQWMRLNTSPTAFSKSDLSAAINAIDQWVEDNTISFNSSLPIPFRTSATVSQKANLLAFILMRRNGLLRTEEDG